MTILLNDGNEEHMMQIGSSLDQVTKKSLISFLYVNVDMFAWTPADMPGIDPEVMTHQLNAKPTYQSIKQKRRRITRIFECIIARLKISITRKKKKERETIRQTQRTENVCKE